MHLMLSSLKMSMGAVMECNKGNISLRKVEKQNTFLLLQALMDVPNR